MKVDISMMLQEYYRCPQLAFDCAISTRLSQNAGYFLVDDDLIGYGRAVPQPAIKAGTTLPRVCAEFKTDGTISLNFDPVEVVTNLRLERHQDAACGGDSGAVVRRLYYLLRPMMPVHFRRYLQAFYLRGWSRIPFPQWPVDCSVDRLHEWLLALALKTNKATEIPLVWFWPKGYSSCVSITHDVETAAGRDFCVQLMDINDFHRIKTAFQVVPEQRYEVSAAFLDVIRKRGFEVNIHDLNHDGHLFASREQFLERVKKINRYGKEFQARGFRAAVLYRRVEWMNELDFAYDMSVPNVAHLDPQRGGCCTVMPFFIGDLLEIPVTASQDYSLFHILHDFSIKIWDEQIRKITQAHGLASFIIHPDYIIEKRARLVYEQLLTYVEDLRRTRNVWVAQPSEINDWWRQRAQMQLIQEGNKWRIEGKGSESACVAYARVEDDRIVYRIETSANSPAKAKVEIVN
jgi:hypothetical protein